MATHSTQPSRGGTADGQHASAAGRWLARVVLHGHLAELDGEATLKMAMWLLVRCGRGGVGQISPDSWSAEVGMGRSAYFDALNTLADRGLLRRVRAPGTTTTTHLPTATYSTTWIQLTEPEGLDEAPPVTRAVTLSLTGPPPDYPEHGVPSPPWRTHQSATADSPVRDGGLVRHGGLARPGVSARSESSLLPESRVEDNNNDDCSTPERARLEQIEQVVVVLRAEGFSEAEARRWSHDRTLAYVQDVIANANHQAKFGFNRSRKAWIFAALRRGSDGLFAELEAGRAAERSRDDRRARVKEISERLDAALDHARRVVERWPESRARRWATDQLRPAVSWHLIHAKWVTEDQCLDLGTRELAALLLERVT